MGGGENVRPTKLKTARFLSGLKQKELAEKASISVTALSLMENGKLLPSLRTLQRISKILGTSLDDLVEEVE
jgi:transcriptional regulator with XRE-family HTH domain